MKIVLVKHNKKTGLIDIKDLEKKINKNTAGFYFENPSYLGYIETQGEAIADILHANKSYLIVGVDPISLGILAPPSNYGADITCGDIQSLGLHQYFGGATGGFMGVQDDLKLVKEYPSRLFGITKTNSEGEWGFGDVLYDERTSFGNREGGKEFVGTAAALWGITAAVYLSLMGPVGMHEIGETIMQKSMYAIKQINKIKGIKAPLFSSLCFKEFVVDYNNTGLTVEQINKALLKKGIYGGKNLITEFPQLGQCALFTITEKHSKTEIDSLVNALNSIIK